MFQQKTTDDRDIKLQAVSLLLVWYSGVCMGECECAVVEMHNTVCGYQISLKAETRFIKQEETD